MLIPVNNGDFLIPFSGELHSRADSLEKDSLAV